MNDSNITMPTSGEATVSTSSGLRRMGLTLLAAFLCLLLVDAAVETLVSGSPLRWIISGTVVGYLALSSTSARKRSTRWFPVLPSR